MRRNDERFFLKVVLALFCAVFISCIASPATTATPVSPPINKLKIGVWKLSGIDETQTIWSADLVVQSIQNSACIGYFDWYSGADEFYRGREYFEGTYLEERQRINFTGTRLEHVQVLRGRRLVLGVYQARLSDDGMKLFDGSWGEHGPNMERGIPGTWQAEWVKLQ